MSKPIYLPFLLLLSSMLWACQPADAPLTPTASPLTPLSVEATICEEVWGGIDLGPRPMLGYEYIPAKAANVSFPVIHPIHPDTLIYLKETVDQANSLLNRREIWWYSFRSQQAERIVGQLHVSSSFDVNRRGEVVFTAPPSHLNVVDFDGNLLYDIPVEGPWYPRWHPNGDTIYFQGGRLGKAYFDSTTEQWQVVYRRGPLNFLSVPNYPSQRLATNVYPSSPDVAHSSGIEIRQSDGALVQWLDLGVTSGAMALIGSEAEWLVLYAVDSADRPTVERYHVPTGTQQRLRTYDHTEQPMGITFQPPHHLLVAMQRQDSLGEGRIHYWYEIRIMDADGCNERKLELPME